MAKEKGKLKDCVQVKSDIMVDDEYMRVEKAEIVVVEY
jgi:hypothetical protein